MKNDLTHLKSTRGNDVISRLSNLMQHQQKSATLNNLETSFDSLFLCLQRKGVSSASIRELRKQIQMSTGNSNDHSRSCTSYINVLEQCQQYVVCIAANMTRCQGGENETSGTKESTLSQTIDLETMFQLIINCWSHLCVYVNQQYKLAYKYHHGLKMKTTSYPMSSCEGRQRSKLVTSSATATSSSPIGGAIRKSLSSSRSLATQVENALQLQIVLAEESCICQKELLIAQANERRQSRRRRAQQAQVAEER